MLFNGSIRANITYGLGHVDDHALYRALLDANALEFVQALPQGWDTVVGSTWLGCPVGNGNDCPSPLIRDPRILLLDEPTSALDPASERHVQDTLDTLKRGRTALVIAHRLATIRGADLIVVLEDGRVIEQGTHAQLISRRGGYARLWAFQHDLA